MTVSVAIDLALDRLFDYTVPEELEKKLAVGQLLSVPFGHRQARGFAMAIVSSPSVGSVPTASGSVPTASGSVPTASEPVPIAATPVARPSSVWPSEKPQTPTYRLKPISAIVDETPFFSEKLLELVKKVAAYTAAPLESVLKAALPAAVLKKNARAKEQLFVEPMGSVPGGDGSVPTGEGSTLVARPSSVWHLEKPPDFIARAGTPLLQIGGGSANPSNLGSVPSAEVSVPTDRGSVPGAEGLTKRQRWLFEQITRLGGGWMAQLCEELKTTPGSLKLLAEKGLVTISVRARRRDPLSGRRVLPTKPLALNEEQQAALEAICGKGESSSSELEFESVARASSPLPWSELVSCGQTEDGLATRGGVAVVEGQTGDGLATRGESGDVVATPVLELKTSTQNSNSALELKTPTPSRPLLLFGVTGSGKTEVYLQAIAKELDAGRGAIVMVPEISLTPQTVRRFVSRFGDRVAMLHSALSDGERYDEWHRIRSGKARVVVGPRSAVWAPVANLGLIVVDEEHEGSYKQDETPRYHARDIAVLRGAIEGAKVVLGSATPSLESWMNVQTGKYAMAEMKSRAGAGTLPHVRLVDRHETRSDGKGGGAIFSPDLLEAIRLRLDRHEQTILFLNRRGYSKSVTCGDCGYVVTCPNCSTPDRGVPYTYHRADSCLRCHVCGAWTTVPTRCPECGSMHLDFRGVGTQRAEAALTLCFPHARVLRMDADSTSRKFSHDDLLSAFGRQEADILIGTQMIAKGLDFPNVTLVGVLNADSSLNLAGSDFRAAERTYQLISQVAGRAGRAELPGEVYVQTYDPSEPAIALAAKGDFSAFAATELKVRKSCGFPPYCRLAVIRFRSLDLKLVGDWAGMYAASLKKCKGLTVSEAMPSALEKADDWYRWMIVVRAAKTSEIVRAWRWIASVRPPVSGLRVSIDIDAINLV